MRHQHILVPSQGRSHVLAASSPVPLRRPACGFGCLPQAPPGHLWRCQRRRSGPFAPAAERAGLRTPQQGSAPAAADSVDLDPGSAEPAHAVNGADTAVLPAARPGGRGDGRGVGTAEARSSPDGTGDGASGSSAAGPRAAPRSGNGAAAPSSSGRPSAEASGGGGGGSRVLTGSRRSGRRGLSAFLRARTDRGRPPAVVEVPTPGASAPARRPPPRVPPGPPQRTLASSNTKPGPAARGGPLAWLRGLRERLFLGNVRAKVDYVPLDFKRAPSGWVVDPFAPPPAPPAPRDVPDLGTIWGLVVLGIAYVHHSTTGFVKFWVTLIPHHVSRSSCVSRVCFLF